MSVTPASSIPVSIDYTSKDFYSLRTELITRIQDRIPNWTASDPADFGVALVEAFAYLGDIMSYYIDRNANESFLSTASQRSSVLNIAQTYGYIPAGYRAAFTTIELTNTSANEITIPAGTVISGDVIIADTVTTLYFSTDVDAVVIEQIGETAGTQTVTATEGRSVTLVASNTNEYGELIGTSTGTPSMVFELGETPVVDGSVEIYVQEGDVYSKWEQIQHLIDSGPTDLVFKLETDENNTVLVYFGDGVSGVIPTLHSEIRARYVVGGGILGNVSTNTLTNIDYVPGLSEGETVALQGALTVTNTAVGLGGSDPETLNQIRMSAPLSLRAGNRAVTLQDYADLALGVTGVGKANALAAVWSSVTLYLAPSRGSSNVELSPGLDGSGDPTIEFGKISEDVLDYLSTKTLLGTSVTIQPPTYIDVIIAIQYTKFDQYTTLEVENSLKSNLLTNFGYNNVFFQDTIYPQDIEFVLNQVSGIKVAKVTTLHREGGSGLLTLTGTAGEIFRFQETNISIGTL